MEFRFDHNNINVKDLTKSLNFYRDALGLVETRRMEAADKSFVLVFLGDSKTAHKLELTWLRDRAEPYNLGDNEFHLAFVADDFKAAFARHKEMGRVNAALKSSATNARSPMISKRHLPATRRWVACAMKIPPWASISSRIPMDIGWKFSQKENSGKWCQASQEPDTNNCALQ